MGTTPTLLLSCSFHSPALLLLCSSPASASALPRPYSCPAPFKLLSGKFIAPPQFLPSSCPLFCPVLLYSALLLPCSCPAHVSAPLLLSSSPAPTLLLVLPIPVWQPSSSPSAPYDFFRHGESRLLWYLLLQYSLTVIFLSNFLFCKFGDFWLNLVIFG